MSSKAAVDTDRVVASLIISYNRAIYRSTEVEDTIARIFTAPE
jgi:hypothetical protein